MAKLMHAVTGQAAPQEIAARQKASDTVAMTNDVSAGATELFYRRRWKYYYLPYSEMIWAYRQVA